MKLRKVYRFRMRPAKAQEAALYRMAGARRFVYNWALERRKSYYAEHGKGITARQLSSELTALKNEPETLWLKDADSQLLQQALKDLQRAFENFFEKRGRFPKFRSRKAGHFAFRIPQRVKVEEGRVYVPKVGWVRIRQSREVQGTTKGATFKRDACGHWYVSLTVESEGTKVEAPRHLRKSDKKLRRAHKALSRKKPGCRRREKARRRVARLHRKVSNQRSDFLHKLSTDLTRKYDCVCIEDLNNRALARTKLSRSVLDAAFGEFRRQIRYKVLWNHKHYVEIDRFYPSTRLCSECGSINSALTLSGRAWLCVCGVQHDRDLNAAKNILAEGLRMLAVGHTANPNARGEPVSLSQREARLDETRILPL